MAKYRIINGITNLPTDIIVDAYQADKDTDVVWGEYAMRAHRGDYVITYSDGDKDVYKPEVFKNAFELVKD